MELTTTTLHVISMTASIVFVSGAFIFGFLGKKSATLLSSIGTVTALIGGFSGFLLLATQPLSFKCLLLSLYLVVEIGIFVYGFGAGNSTRARLIRAK